MRPSRIASRLLAFDLLLLFLPIAGVLYLDVYEARLLEAQERSDDSAGPADCRGDLIGRSTRRRGGPPDRSSPGSLSAETRASEYTIRPAC